MTIVQLKRSEIPPMSEERKAQLRALAQRPDDEIDCSDIPELTEEFWQNAMTAEEAQAFRQKQREEQNSQDSKALQGIFDKDVFSWLTHHGKHYHQMINQSLRQVIQQTAVK